MAAVRENASKGRIRQRTKPFRWTPSLIKQLRGKRTLSEFGGLLGTPKNTVWRWETARAHPDAVHAERLSEVAERERFLEDWKLVGSVTILGDLDTAQAEIAALFRKSLKRTAREIEG